MRKIFFFAAILLFSLSGYVVSRRIDLNPSQRNHINLAVGKEKIVPLTVISTEKPPVQKQEDPDILNFIQKYSGSQISEKVALNLLESDLSQNKKSVILSLYYKQGGAFLDPSWNELLLNLILTADDWLELANKAADCLRNANKDGVFDESILQSIADFSNDEIGLVKKSALAFSLVRRESIEGALIAEKADVVLENLASHHASLLSNSERLQAFQADSREPVRSKYMDSYLKDAQTQDELLGGLTKGWQDAKILPVDRAGFTLAAADSKVIGKSKILFDYWKSLLPLSKQNKDFMSVLNIAVQTASYSEKDSSFAESVFKWLMSQQLNSKDDADPKIYLAILMANACNDPLVEKVHCQALRPYITDLSTQLMAIGLGSYIMEAVN